MNIYPTILARFRQPAAHQPSSTWVPALISLCLLMLSGSLRAGPFTAGNLAVIQADASANNTTCSVIELSPATAGQTPANIIAIDGTSVSALRFSGSASSTAYLSRTDDGTLLTFNGANNTNTSSNVNTLNPRGVGTLGSAGTFTLQTTYTGGSGNQTRSSTSLDNSIWFIADQGGIYTNGSISASPSGNIRAIRVFDGVVHIVQSAGTTIVSTVSAPSGGTITGLPGLPAPTGAEQDFYLVSSGSNGSTLDVLYVLSATSSTAGTIAKYSLVSGTWTANGSYTTAFGGFGLAAAKSGAGAVLYVSTGNGATTNNSVLKLTDTAGFNSAISITTGDNVTLYTATGSKIVKGVAFAPVNIRPSGALSAVSTTYGAASSETSFAVSAVGLTADLLVTAPSGFEVSTTSGAGFAGSVSLSPSGGTVADTTIFVRLASTTGAGSHSGNVTLTSTGVAAQNVAMPASVVNPAALTIAGVSAVSKPYDGTTTATLSGTAAYVGLVNGESFSVTGTPVANFDTAAVGTGKTVTVTGYTPPTTNYTVTQPTGLTADITAAPPELVLTEINSNASGGDFWELTNVGTAAADVGNWKWIDSGQSLPAPAVQVIPAGTMIAPGETVVFITNTATSTAFLAAWGPLSGVQKFVGGPGLGSSDSVRFYDSSDNLIFTFSYGVGGFTRSDGSASAGGHAGASAGGVAEQSAVIDPAFGTGAGRRYTAATAGVNGAYANTAGGSNIGSPGATGLGGGGPTITLTVNIAPATFSESATNPAASGTVTRSGATTGDLLVNLSSSDTTEATVPATVTILDGQASAPFNVTAVDDSFPDGSKIATITASASGATAGTFDVTVTDDGDVLVTNVMLTEVLSQQAAAGVSDFWELTNMGASSVSLAGYSWHDSGRSAATAATYALPPGSSIAPGESVIFTTITPAAFRTWWGISNSVQVFQTVGAPGLGQNDGVSFFDNGGNEIFFFNYAAGGFTKADGNPSTGGHAGSSAGASTETQSAIWVPSSGTASPRYTFATVGNEGCFASAASALDIGSPGISVGNPTVSIADASVVEGHSGTTTLALNVTRSSTDTAFTVGYAVTGGDATSGTDYATLASGMLTFTAAGDATQPINITVNGDTDSEDDETIVVTLSNVVNTTGTTVIGDDAGTGTILNDDVVAPMITMHPANTTIATTYTATLAVAASGFPVSAIQWYQGNSGDTNTPVGTNSTSFTTPALSVTTSYWARATNAGGSADSNTATVTVTTGPIAVDLSKYVRVGRFDLPEPTRTTPPLNNLLGQEASGVTYNWDTDTLFIVGDGGTSVTQVTKTGALVSTMTLPPGGSSQGTEFFDTEGITYIGGGQFVFTEERDRQAVKFTYLGGGTLLRSAAQTVKLGTTIGNVGLEGLTYDPQTSGFIFVKEAEPIGIFETTIDFNAGTASNGSPSTVNSTDLFDPALASLEDMSDVFAFSNLPSMTGQPSAGNLLILSQESGMIRQVDRSGNILGTLTLVADAGNPLTIQNQTHEGLTMDRAGNIYVVSENGGGDTDHPQLWVYAPSEAANFAPTALALSTSSSTIPDSTSTALPVKMATIVVTDADGVGVNNFSVSGADAADFQFIGSGLYLKAGTVLNGTTKPTYNVIVNVDDTMVGITPDASANFTLNVTGAGGGGGTIRVTEVAPWSSGNSPGVLADWFELTNTGSTAVVITGWKMFDSGAGGFGSSGPLNGITSIAAGESVIFVDGQAKIAPFISNWFGSNPPPGLQVGYYGGPGLSTGGDAVTIYNGSGTLQARVDFGASPGVPGPFGTFDNSAALNNVTVTQLSVVGANGAFTAAATSNEIGSPGIAVVSGSPLVSIVATDASASETGPDAGTFRISRTGSTTSAMTVIYTIATGAGHAVSADYTPTLTSPATILEGDSFVDITITPVNDTDVEGNETVTLTLGDTGSYDVGSPSFATITIEDNDSPNQAPTAVALNNTVLLLSESTSTAADVRVADISVTDDGLGTNTLSVSGADAGSFTITGSSLYLKAGTALSYANKPTYNVTVNVDDTTVGLTPDASTTFTLSIAQSVAPGTVVISEVAPWSSSNGLGLLVDWFEVTNSGTVTVNLSGWKVDDNSHASGTAVALNGVTSIAPGESVIFIESNAPSTVVTNFRNLWFGTALPAGVQIGTYTGSGIGLSGSGDEVTLFDAAGNIVTGIGFGGSPATAPFTTFDNTAGSGSNTLPFPVVTTFSAVGVNGAFAAKADPNEIGSPGNIGTGRLIVTEVAPWSSTSGVGLTADWFEVTNIGVAAVDITGWKVDDSSNAIGSALLLNGITSIAPGESVIFIETSGSQTAAGNAANFRTLWFGSNAPAGLQIGSYTGSGIGLSTSGDAVNLYDSGGVRRANVVFGAAPGGPSFATFDNAACLTYATISTLSVAGTNGAFAATGDANEIGSPGAVANYTLQILHYYGESGLLGIETAPILGAMIDRFDGQYSNTIVLGEGDSFIPGPWLVAGADPSFNMLLHTTASISGGPAGAFTGAAATTAVPFAQADIAIMNAFGTTASALGNHEFDLGSPVLAGAVFPANSTSVGNWQGAQFPLITANLDFANDSSLRTRADSSLGGTGSGSIGVAGSEVTAIKAKIAPYAIKTLNGEKIGIVGATTWELLTKSSPNGTVPKDDANGSTSDLQEVAAYLQGAVNALQALGVDKIVMVDQLDALQRNKDLAPLVSGIDIMVAGGGHERMGDGTDTASAFNGHDADFIADSYPIVTSGLDGAPVLIVTTDTEYTYLGRLVADFDAGGRLILPNLNPALNGAYVSTETALQAAYGTTNSAATIIASSTIGTQVKAITDAINSIVVAKDSNVFGYTNVYLEGDRVFGRTQEVNLGNITADANAAVARTALGLSSTGAVFSLKNGGGIRASVGSVLANGTKVGPLANPITGKPANAISQLDVENALRFDNKLMVCDMTPTGLLGILNFAAGLSSGPTVQNGGYPQVGNIRFSYDSAQPAGQKVRSAVLINDLGQVVAPLVENGIVHVGAPASFQAVILNFTMNGGDGYPIKYLNPPTNTTPNNEVTNFRFVLTNGTLSAPVARNLDFTATSTFTGLGLTAADIMGEQKAFQDYLLARHPATGSAYNIADTPVALDTRIQQIAQNGNTDTVLNGYTAPSYSIAYSTYSVPEDDGFVTVYVERTGATPAADITFTTTDGTAHAGVDYTAPSTTVHFNAGATSVPVDIAIADLSGTPQGNRSFTAAITAVPAGSSIGSLYPSTTITITEPVGMVAFVSTAETVTPVNSSGLPNNLLISLQRTGGAGGAASVDVSKTGGTILPAEFTFTNPTTVSFADGETSKTVSVQLNAIPAAASRTIILGLSGATGATLGTPASTTITISKKDTTAPLLTVVFGVPNASGLVNVSGSTADSGTVFTGINRVELAVVNVNDTGTPTSLALAAGPFNQNVQLQHGSNKLTITAFDNSGNKTIKSATLTFTNPVVTALAGTYTGLVLPSAVTPSNDNIGLLTVTATATGTLSGKLMISGVSASFSGALDNAGDAHFKPTNAKSFGVIDKTEFESYLGALSVNIAGTQAVGTLKTSASGSVLASATALKQATAADAALLNSGAAQKYSVAFPSQSQSGLTASEVPQGDGYASVTVSPNGTVSAAGVLADGAAFSTSGKLHAVSGATQSVSLHRNLYRGRGALAVELVFDLVTGANADSDVLGADAVWLRPALARARYYKAGWPSGVTIDAIGARFTVPAASSVLPGLVTTSPNALLQFADGGITGVLTRDLDISTTNVFINKSTDTALKLTITKSTGVFKGAFTHPDTTQPAYKGIILQEGANAKGFGFFLTTPPLTYGGSGESGGVTLLPHP